MIEPTITCPKCSSEIKLTESLAAPLLEQAEKKFHSQLAAKDAEFARKSEEIRAQQHEVAIAREQIDELVATKLKSERSQIAASEARKAREAAALELENKDREAAELRELLARNNEKLAAAQKDQAELLRKQREIEDAQRELDLTVQKKVHEELAHVRAKAKQEAEDELKLKVSEKDHQIAGMARTIEELKRKAEQTSQQVQGEVLELELEDVLKARFPTDIIEPVAKGELGADVVQRVNGAIGTPAGVILWESKRTKNWSDGWLPKLRDDQRRCGADVALVISNVLPKEVENFDFIDGIWIAHPRCAVPVAVALRQSLVAVNGARSMQQGQLSKAEEVYRYLTGKGFRQRLEAIVERFNDMREDLDKERKFMTRLWAKRESQLSSVVESTIGMYGDLQGIAGKAMPEIESFDMPLLDGPDAKAQRS
ncbi:DUF2130 domain-containing protein [Bradyrhizobium sp. CCBAU 53421]|uniref:DUF2130 domain-containing protein n=1 Tax=Bradyrhizobium sp. CCBAU 53421 TaxID=1325120 RepID=UPI00188A4E23|nr:DUF2130 domain-containing protein [Bradyrhizobium sp. CCBAU 53421]QOZ36345.1 DUF2130 domain-containing protein [Bradyrhizobium sp. CCBAU 53421]